MKPGKKRLIIALSIVIPVIVALLFGIRIETETDFSGLPRIYAGINFVTFLSLIMALVSIKQGNRKRHERFIIFSLLLTTVFLVLYITYHITTDSTAYGGEGFIRYIYFFILISHILLSIVVIPLVLISIGWATEGIFVKHKKIARIAMPVWLYVALSGVIVYLMISPYYG